MPRLIIDMDEVMADTYQKFVDAYAREFGRIPTDEELYGKKVYDLPGAAHLRDAMYERGFFRDVIPMPGAIEVVRELYEYYEVYVVTTATEFRYSFTDKYEWLEEHLPFIHYRRIVFCGDKNIVHGDFMIDDKVSNLSGFNGKGLLFTSRHNLNDSGYQRVENWQEVQSFFRKERAERLAELA